MRLAVCFSARCRVQACASCGPESPQHATQTSDRRDQHGAARLQRAAEQSRAEHRRRPWTAQSSEEDGTAAEWTRGGEARNGAALGC